MMSVIAIQKFLRRSAGATAIEYGLIAALIAVAVITAVTQTGEETKKPFETIGNAVKASNAAN